MKREVGVRVDKFDKYLEGRNKLHKLDHKLLQSHSHTFTSRQLEKTESGEWERKKNAPKQSPEEDK